MGTPVTTASGHVTYICLSLEEACILQLWRLVLSSLRGSTGCSAPWEFFLFIHLFHWAIAGFFSHWIIIILIS